MIRRQRVSELTFEIDLRKKRELDYMDLDNELQYLTYLISETEQINPSA